METVVLLIMLLVALGFLLKLTCHGRIGCIVLCFVSAAFVLLTTDLAVSQSKSRIADWLQRPDLMLDTSVVLTVDVFFQILFCVLMAGKLAGGLPRKAEILRRVTLWFPGLLIFPVLFSALVEVIFAMPGVDFCLIGYMTAATILVGMPLLAWLIRWLLPEEELRLEMLFLVSLLTAALGIVATVNGRTAAVGTGRVEWTALGAVFGLILAGAVAGYFIYNYRIHKQINNLQ